MPQTTLAKRAHRAGIAAIWGGGEEKFGILIPGVFDGQISTDIDPIERSVQTEMLGKENI